MNLDRNLLTFSAVLFAGILAATGAHAKGGGGGGGGHAGGFSHGSATSHATPTTTSTVKSGFGSAAPHVATFAAVGLAGAAMSAHTEAATASGKSLSVAQQSDQSAKVLSNQNAKNNAPIDGRVAGANSSGDGKSGFIRETQQPATFLPAQVTPPPQITVVHTSSGPSWYSFLLMDSLMHHDREPARNEAYYRNYQPATSAAQSNSFSWLSLFGYLLLAALVAWLIFFTYKLFAFNTSSSASPKYSID